MKAIVLAGGKGTRLAPYTKILPKPLMPIGDMPILEVLIRQMKAACWDHGRPCIDEVILTVGHLAGLLKAFFNDGSQFGMPISYVVEDHPLGTAGPLAFVPGLEEPFLVMNGDVLTTLPLNELIRYHIETCAAATIAMHRRQVKIDLGVIQCNEQNEIVNYIEKPTYDYMVSMGIYVFEPHVLSYIRPGQYLDFPDLVHQLLDTGEKVTGLAYDGYWQDLGSPGDYEQANQDFESMRSSFLPDGC